MKNLQPILQLLQRFFMDRPKKEIYCDMPISILQKFVYILYLCETSVFKYLDMDKCFE